jgi:hypothetical protein
MNTAPRKGEKVKVVPMLNELNITPWRCMGERKYNYDSWPRHYMELNGKLHAPAALPPGKEPPLLLRYEVGWPKSRSGRCGVEKNLLPLPGMKPQPSSPKPVIIPAEISRLYYRRDDEKSCPPPTIVKFGSTFSISRYNNEKLSVLSRLLRALFTLFE